MTKTNHHYVPQFYLKLFASDKHLSERPRRIHLFNIKNSLLKENVSIKDQCYKRKFYGDTDELENALSEFEGICSWLLSQIIKLERLPPNDLPAYQLLLNFILVQHFRTKREADIQNQMWDGFLKAVYEEDVEQFTEDDWKKIFGENAKPLKRDELDNFKFRMKDPVILSLSLVNADIVSLLDDLESHLVLSSGHKRFVVGDNPVVIYNQYYEWLKEMSNTGLVSKGIQIFLPLSPQSLLILYDKNIYHISGNQRITRDISDKDLQSINLLQFMNADQNVFFDKAEQINDVQKINVIAKPFRRDDKVKTIKFDGVRASSQQGESVLFTSFTQTPNVHLDLSFMKIKRSAEKVPVRKRLDARYRRDLPDELTKQATPPNMPKRFIRRKNKED